MRIKKPFLALSSIFIIFLLFFVLLFSGWITALSPKGKISPNDLNGQFDSSAKTAYFNNQEIDLALLGLEKKRQPPPVLGETTESKRIEIDLTHQRLYAYEGDRLVYSFLVSSGKWGRTPTGRFRIWIKLRYSKMEGGSPALNTYYYLPNVPFVMYFYNSQTPQSRGYGIHGTYWHDNFGHPMSHGCVNMKTEEVALLYYWARPDLKGKNSIWATTDNPGTEIVIYGRAPWQ